MYFSQIHFKWQYHCIKMLSITGFNPFPPPKTTPMQELHLQRSKCFVLMLGYSFTTKLKLIPFIFSGNTTPTVPVPQVRVLLLKKNLFTSTKKELREVCLETVVAQNNLRLELLLQCTRNSRRCRISIPKQPKIQPKA